MPLAVTKYGPIKSVTYPNGNVNRYSMQERAPVTGKMQNAKVPLEVDALSANNISQSEQKVNPKVIF